MTAVMTTSHSRPHGPAFRPTGRTPRRAPRLPGRLTTATLIASLGPGAAAAPLVSAALRAGEMGSRAIHCTYPSALATTINGDRGSDPYPSAIQIPGLRKSKVANVNAGTHSVTHDPPANVDIVLQAPDDASTRMSDDGAVAYVQDPIITLDDQPGNTLCPLFRRAAPGWRRIMTRSGAGDAQRLRSATSLLVSRQV